MAHNSNSHDAPWLPNSQTEMFSVYAGNARSSCLVVGGPAALKLRSPKLLCVRGTKHVLTAAERRGQRSVSVTSRTSSARYAGVRPASDWHQTCNLVVNSSTNRKPVQLTHRFTK